jgi:hypothetical protein
MLRRAHKALTMSEAPISKRVVILPGDQFDLDLKYDPDICADRFLIYGGTGTLQCIVYAKRTHKYAEDLRARLEEIATTFKYRESPLANMVVTLSPCEAGVDVIVDFTRRPIEVSQSTEHH